MSDTLAQEQTPPAPLAPDAGPRVPIERFRALAGGLDHPEGVAWDPLAARVYAGGEAGQVYEIGLDGSMRQCATTGGFLLGLAVDGSGRVYGCDVGRAEVVRVDPRTGSVETYAKGAPERPMAAPNWLAFDAAGNLYVTDSGDWAAADGFIWRIEPGGRSRMWTDESRLLPNGCCLDLDGSSLFVVETNLPGIVRIPIRPDGSAGRRAVFVEMPGTTPDGVAMAADGTLLVACYRPDGIYAVSAGGSIELLVHDPHGQTLGAPANVAFAGERLDRIVTSNLGRWHVAIGDAGLRGPGLPRPRID